MIKSCKNCKHKIGITEFPVNEQIILTMEALEKWCVHCKRFPNERIDCWEGKNK